MKLQAEVLAPSTAALTELRKLVAMGEGLRLEFKRKIAYPEKVARELIAFANTQGGVLLVGVDDDGALPGVPYPEEEILEIRKVLQQRVVPRLGVKTEILALNKKKFIVRVEVNPHPQRPVYFVNPDGKRDYFVRYQDQSMKASFEMREIIRQAKWKRDIHFTFGEAESKLLSYLSNHSSITLSDFRALVRLPRKEASGKLIKLVLANILRITPSEKGDLYSRV
jgi:predicted HTH transcriptional regulator